MTDRELLKKAAKAAGMHIEPAERWPETVAEIVAAERAHADALQAELAAEKETVAHLVRALSEEVNGPTFMGEPVLPVLKCGHHVSLMLKSAETGKPLYCELCDAVLRRNDAELMEQEYRKRADALEAALRELVDAHEAEAKATLTLEVAQANYSKWGVEEHAAFEAAMRASRAEKAARALLKPKVQHDPTSHPRHPV